MNLLSRIYLMDKMSVRMLKEKEMFPLLSDKRKQRNE